MLDLVDNYSEVVRNAKEFHDSIDVDIIKKLSQFRHWYYIEEIGGFAPSKFIGYKDITIEDYIEGTERGRCLSSKLSYLTKNILGYKLYFSVSDLPLTWSLYLYGFST